MIKLKLSDGSGEIIELDPDIYICKLINEIFGNRLDSSYALNLISILCNAKLVEFIPCISQEQYKTIESLREDHTL